MTALPASLGRAALPRGLRRFLLPFGMTAPYALAPLMGADAISATTRLCAVYGHPVKHSASPAMHNAALPVLGLNWRYLAFDVPPDNLRDAISGAAAMRFIGLNLTVPHKILAMDMVDDLDESARTWGAVNTVLFEGRNAGGQGYPWRPLRDCDFETLGEVRTRGFNTDADAIPRSLQEDLGLKLSGATVLLLGAGGAGRTAALKLASEGVKQLYLINRTRTKAEGVAGEIQKRFPSVKTSCDYPEGPVDLVVNATSLGLRVDDPLPFETGRFSLKQAAAAYDMIYRPSETRFLAEAAQNGCKIANGLGMLLYQGARSLEIWTGLPAPVDVMRAALKEQIYGKA
jgi:shikimate dehydrogenase